MAKYRKTDGVSLDIDLVGDLLALANRLHRLPHDPHARKHTLLEGLAGVVDARSGACIVAHDDGSGSPTLLSATLLTRGHAHGKHSHRPRRRRRGRSDTRAISGLEAEPLVRRVLAHVFPRTASFARRERQGDLTDAEQMLFSCVRPKQPGTVAAVGLSREPRPFSPHDQQVVDLVHAHMVWIYALDLPLASPDVLELAPRPQQTLQLLLAGNGEKEIASRLGVSHNTVHTYVKQLYRHFHVSSRTELLSRWVRE